MPLRLAVMFSIRAVARVRNAPRPVRYASRTPSSPTILPPAGRSGPGTNRISSSSVASGWATRWRAAATTSTRLCGAMLVAIPTAIPDAPLTSRLGTAAARYTEARLAPAAMAMVADLDEDVVDFVPNYDNKLTQPGVLPA